MKIPVIQVIMACHNRPEKTMKCLEALHQQTGEFQLGITVVDSSSNPQTRNRIRDKFKKVEIIPTSENSYWTESMKTGWETSIALAIKPPTHWVWVNDDVIPDVDAIQRLLQTSEKHNAIVVGSLKCPETGTLSFGGKIRTGIHPGQLDPLEPQETQALPIDTFEGNLVLIPEIIRLKTGCLGKFRHNFGDIDYGLRATELGILSVVAPGWFGTCPKNPERDQWHTLPSAYQRIRNIMHVKNVPTRDWARFLRNNSKGTCLQTILWFLSPYIKALSGVLPRSQQPVDTLLLWNYVPIHFAGWMRQLNLTLPNSKFLLSAKMDKTRRWKPDLTDIRYEIQKCISKVNIQHHPWGFNLPNEFHLPYSTIPDILHHRPKIVITTEAGARSLQALLLSKLTGKFKIAIQMRESETTALFRGLIRNAIRRVALPNADIIIVNGESGKRVAESYGVPDKKIRIIRSGTDLETFLNIPEKQPTKDQELKLLYVGEISGRKGIQEFTETLAETLKERPDLKKVILTLVGTGEWAFSNELPENLEIRQEGWKEYKTLPNTYIQHDVFVMPSLADEWGMVVNEALACRLPVIGCTGSQAVEELVTENCGWIYPPKNTEAMKGAIIKMITTPAENLPAMGNNARETALKCSDAQFVSGILEIINELKR